MIFNFKKPLKWGFDLEPIGIEPPINAFSRQKVLNKRTLQLFAFWWYDGYKWVWSNLSQIDLLKFLYPLVIKSVWKITHLNLVSWWSHICPCYQRARPRQIPTSTLRSLWRKWALWSAPSVGSTHVALGRLHKLCLASVDWEGVGAAGGGGVIGWRWVDVAKAMMIHTVAYLCLFFLF